MMQKKKFEKFQQLKTRVTVQVVNGVLIAFGFSLNWLYIERHTR